MHTITHAIDTRPFFLLPVLLEKKRPGNKANTEAAIDGEGSVIDGAWRNDDKSTRMEPVTHTSSILTYILHHSRSAASIRASDKDCFNSNDGVKFRGNMPTSQVFHGDHLVYN